MAPADTTKLAFEVVSKVDPSVVGPRLGRLLVPGRKDLDTPNFYAITSRGAAPHMTPDVVAAHTEFGGVHMALEDFIEKAKKGAPPILSCPGPSPLHSFNALPKRLATLLAPRRCPAVSAPNGNTNTAISIFTSTGFQVLSNKEYASYINTLQPDIAIGLADIPHGTQPGVKRIAKMGDRTQSWLYELMSLKTENQAVFAPVLAIDFLDQSEYINYIADDLADSVSGLAFYDSHILADIPATTAVAKLPRLSLDEPSSPAHILRQISLGMDIFTIPFIGFATDAGIALDFTFPRPLESASKRDTTTTNGTSLLPLGIDMWPSTHSTSTTPLSAHCTCYTCTSHHRAFIQHLLSAKEMLGWVLLQIHNHHVMSTFFSSIRESIAKRSFGEDCRTFEMCYESELPEKSGQGPRARGYHFKSEGPGEPKKNKAAWGDLGPGETAAEGLVPDEKGEVLEEKGVAEKVDSKDSHES